MTTTIYHPKTKELFGTIKELELTPQEKSLDFGAFETVDAMGWEDWHETFEEAKAELERSLENMYNGSTQAGMAADRREAEQERQMGA